MKSSTSTIRTLERSTRPAPIRALVPLVMGLLAWFERILERQAQPTAPARSVFGDQAEWDRAERAASDKLEFEIAKERGRPRGF